MKSPGAAEADESFEALLRRSIAAQNDAAATADLRRAVTAGAVAGAMAGAVAGANAAAAVQAATVRSQSQSNEAALLDGCAALASPRGGGAALASPVTPAASQSRSPPPSASSASRCGDWARAFDNASNCWYYYHARTLETTWTVPADWKTYLESESDGLARDLAQTALVERSGGAACASPLRAEAASSSSPPSLYARDTDIETQEEVDPRVGAALDEMNNAMCMVNDVEAGLTQAKRRARLVEAEQKLKCQAAFDKLSRGVKEALPVCRQQILARQQVEKTRLAFVEYQRAHDAHAEAKAAAAAVESRLMASSGGSVVDTDLLSQSSDLASRVVEAESRKLKADRIHAIEARRLSELNAGQSPPRISKDHVERALQFMELKARAEAALLAELDRVKLLERQLRDAKQAYTDAMSLLDSISRDIHLRRSRQGASASATPPPSGEHAADAAGTQGGDAAGGTAGPN